VADVYARLIEQAFGANGAVRAPYVAPGNT